MAAADHAYADHAYFLTLGLDPGWPDDQRIRAIVAPPAVCPGCVAEAGGFVSAAVTSAHCPRHLAAMARTVPRHHGTSRTFTGSARLALVATIRAHWIALTSLTLYHRAVQWFIHRHAGQAIPVALTQVATLTTQTDDWLVVLGVLYELHALPDPLVITFAAGVTHLPFVETGVMYG